MSTVQDKSPASRMLIPYSLLLRVPWWAVNSSQPPQRTGSREEEEPPAPDLGTSLGRVCQNLTNGPLEKNSGHSFCSARCVLLLRMDVTGEDEWSDWEDEDIPARSLIEDKTLPSAKASAFF